MGNNIFNLTFSQCKQIVELGEDLRSIVEGLNEQPEWLLEMGGIDNISELQRIQKCGCASGAYMPAVTYHTTLEIMGKYSDDILDFINDYYGEVPQPKPGTCWSGMAAFYVSIAVEEWCNRFSNLSYIGI